MNQNNTATIIRTLLINGYTIEAFERPAPQTSMIRVRKYDRLGAEARAILLFAAHVSAGLETRLIGEASRHNARPILVALTQPLAVSQTIRQHSLPEFYELLGGEVRTDRIFDSRLPGLMNELGHNRLPDGFTGRADDLLEAYCEEGIEFLLHCPVSRFGQERRFEKLPDGLALGQNRFNLYFDAKAYGTEFHPSADDIRRFAGYVKDFNEHYARYVGAISVFLVISGSFSTDLDAIHEKNLDLQAECSTPLVLMSATQLAKAVMTIRPNAMHRTAINWKRVFAQDVFDPKRLESELTRIKKDGIL